MCDWKYRYTLFMVSSLGGPYRDSVRVRCVNCYRNYCVSVHLYTVLVVSLKLLS